MAGKIDKFLKPPTDKIQAIGVGLRLSEIQALESLGVDLGDYLNAEPVARNALMRIAIKRLLSAYENNELTLEELAEYFRTPEKPQPRLRF